MKHPSYVGTTRKSGGRPVWTGKVQLIESALDIPRKWKKPRKIFVNSMSDLFQDSVPDEFISAVWSAMLDADHHVYQVLTKRPENMRHLVGKLGLKAAPHIWLGTSVESEEFTGRIEELKATPAGVRFISFEPLLGPIGSIDLSGIHWAIVGGESGPGSRPIEPAWIDEIKTACRRNRTAFFFKQWGGPNKKTAGRVFRGRTWNEYPSMARDPGLRRDDAP